MSKENMAGPKVLVRLKQALETGDYEFLGRNAIRFYAEDYEDGEQIVTPIEVRWS